MNQNDLIRAVAETAEETTSTIKRLGFPLAAPADPRILETEGLSIQKEKTQNQQNSCRWIDPSDDSLPSETTTAHQDCRSRSIRTRKAILEIQEHHVSGILTVSEKEYWANRIAERIDKSVETISARDPHLWDRIQRESRQRALASLSLREMQEELDAIEQQRSALEKRKRQLERSMLAQIRGVSMEEIDDYQNCRHHREVALAVQRRQAVHKDELLAESEIGLRILKLWEEKEDLLDAVWLATSPKQIKKLRSKVAELLDGEQPPLQREALAIVPADD